VNPRRVLVVRSDGLGDVVLTGPAIRAVAASGAEVTVLAGPAGAEAGSRLPGVARVLIARLPWIDAQAEPVRRPHVDRLVADLAAWDFDEAIVCTSFHQSPLPTALVARLAGIPRVGAISVDYPGSLLDVRHAVDEDRHEVERALSLVAEMGYALAPHDDASLRIAEAPAHRPTGYVVVHPGASVPARTWSPTRWSDLVAHLDRAGLDTVVTGGAAERGLTSSVAGAGRHSLDRGGITALDDLLAVIAGADAIVVGNTGPAHLAAALGTPVVSLYPPTVPAARWRPWRVPHVLLGDQDVSCGGCRARTCPRTVQQCLEPITPADVLAALERLAPAATPVLAGSLRVHRVPTGSVSGASP
jgi:ADP-heptose:LPS heptosyltransferase